MAVISFCVMITEHPVEEMMNECGYRGERGGVECAPGNFSDTQTQGSCFVRSQSISYLKHPLITMFGQPIAAMGPLPLLLMRRMNNSMDRNEPEWLTVGPARITLRVLKERKVP